jgi:hypothetical protein
VTGRLEFILNPQWGRPGETMFGIAPFGMFNTVISLIACLIGAALQVRRIRRETSPGIRGSVIA